MARGFDAVYGVGTTDQIVSAVATHSTQRTYALWVWRSGAADADAANNQRMWDKRVAGAQVDCFVYDGSGDAATEGFSFQRLWSPVGGKWYWTKTTFKTWVQVVLTYDGNSASNVPAVYYNGVLQTLNTVGSPSGTISTNTDAYVIGNRGNDSGRCWNGRFAEFAIWDRILTAGEITALAAGKSPTLFPTPVEYIKMNDSPVTSSITTAPTVTGTRAAEGPTIDYGIGAINYHRKGASPRNAMNPVLTSGRLL